MLQKLSACEFMFNYTIICFSNKITWIRSKTDYQSGLGLIVWQKKTNKQQIQSNSGLNMIEVYFSFKHKSLRLEHSLMSGTQNLFSFLLIHVCPWLTVYGGGIHILEIRVEEMWRSQAKDAGMLSLSRGSQRLSSALLLFASTRTFSHGNI